MTLVTRPQPSMTENPGHDAVVWLLRIEGAAALCGALAAYAALGGSWILFAAAFLLPDLAMLGYLAGPRIGAATYNAAHTYTAPAALAVLGLVAQQPLPTELAVIWGAHIGFDRLLGYGLKFSHAFGATHLGWKGEAPSRGNTGR